MPVWNLFVKGMEGKTMTFVLESQPSELRVKFVKLEIQKKTCLPPAEQRLIFDGKQLEDDRFLSSYNISNCSTLFLVMRLVGGTARPSPPLVRKIDSSVPRSEEQCMIMFIKDEDNVKMPCGHTISPDALINYSWNEVCVNGKVEVKCCLCTRHWDSDTIQRYGGASDEEMRLLHECVSRNFCLQDPDISECPGCSGLCQRMDKNNKCSVCRICTAKKKKTFQFCWDCKKEWVGCPSNKHCGNDKCSKDMIVEQLRTCPEKEIRYLKGLKCPSMRACPNCASLIEHKDQCKHMTCKVCKKEFCFVCLRIVVHGSSACGIYDTKCAVAPRQTRLNYRS